MSTRAIIALPTAKGYRTAWVWNDAFPDQLGKMLKTKFNTEKLVRELVNNVNFGSMMTKNMKADFEKEFPENAGFKELSNGMYLYDVRKRTVVGKGCYGFFRTIDEMLEQDLNYVYLFNNGKWDRY